jgi:DNA mismatch repair protein MutS2
MVELFIIINLMNEKTISERVLSLLEWNSILKELSSRCATSIGRQIITQLKPLPAENIKRQLKEISELKELMIQGNSPDLTGISDIGPLLDIAAKEGVLSISDICQIRDFISASNRIIVYISKNKHKLDFISRRFIGLNKFTALADLLNSSITEDNELNINKYPELKKIKENLFNAKQEIENKLSRIIHSPVISAAIQEKIHTIRNERYVILVKANMKEKVKGNLHDLSSSGSTLYIEPDEVTGLNNRLIMLERDYKIEIFRILRLLSKEIANNSEGLHSNLGVLPFLDFLSASSKLSISIRANEPEIFETAVINLRSARHPLLSLMNPDSVVPNDISLGKEFNCMIISGANTGGKTVLLKTIGLCALLAMHGLHIPASPDSSIGIFTNILTDIGDDQNILESLSTYSGQIVIINEMITAADKHTLILIDEILVGTNPRQGSVLAQAVLEKLVNTNAKIVVTTHYSELKDLPVTDKRFQNASVSFDVGSLRPTYHLRIGLPGTSYAIDIAKLYGMNESILNRASELLDSRETSADALIENVQKYKEEMEEERRKTDELNADLEAEKNKYYEMLTKLNLRIEEVKNQKGIEFLDELNKYRKELSEKKRNLIIEEPKEIEKFRKDIKEMQTKISATLKKNRKNRFLYKYKSFDPALAKSGDKVFIAPIEKEAVIESINPDNKSVFVMLGNSIKARYKFDDLLIPSSKNNKTIAEVPPKKQTDKPVEKDSNNVNLTIQTQYNTSDLRGLKVDEAINRLDSDLDKMIRSGVDTVVVIHGHGTGALKEAVRKWLAHSYHVKNFRPGKFGEGGDGVSIVLLKD